MIYRKLVLFLFLLIVSSYGYGAKNCVDLFNPNTRITLLTAMAEITPLLVALELNPTEITPFITQQQFSQISKIILNDRFSNDLKRFLIEAIALEPSYKELDPNLFEIIVRHIDDYYYKVTKGIVDLNKTERQRFLGVLDKLLFLSSPNDIEFLRYLLEDEKFDIGKVAQLAARINKSNMAITTAELTFFKSLMHSNFEDYRLSLDYIIKIKRKVTVPKDFTEIIQYLRGEMHLYLESALEYYYEVFGKKSSLGNEFAKYFTSFEHSKSLLKFIGFIRTGRLNPNKKHITLFEGIHKTYRDSSLNSEAYSEWLQKVLNVLYQIIYSNLEITVAKEASALTNIHHLKTLTATEFVSKYLIQYYK